MRVSILLALIALAVGSPIWGAEAAIPLKSGTGEQTLAASSAEKKFTFVLFYKEDNAARQQFATTLSESLKEKEQATWTEVKVTNPEEKAIVDKFKLSRTPMPLVLAIAPNGAITGVFPKTLTADLITASIVSPTKTRVMKTIQDNKLALVYVNGDAKNLPKGIKDFAADPHYTTRHVVHMLHSEDPAEVSFLKDLGVSATSLTPTVCLLASPGVVVGKWPATVTGSQMSTALHAAGKCCDDPNCKHNHTTTK